MCAESYSDIKKNLVSNKLNIEFLVAIMEIGDRALNRFYSDLGDGRSDMGDNSRRISTYSSDADKIIITAASSESNESSNANNVEEEGE